MKNRTTLNIATVFGLGKLPLAPGTWGSFAGLILCMVLHANLILYITVFTGLLFLGAFAAGEAERIVGGKDPACIVIDEFVCIFPVFFLIPADPLYVFTGFVLYRLMDVIKLPPARRLEKIEGGWGIMLDDLSAAVYTNLILHIIVYLRVF